MVLKFTLKNDSQESTNDIESPDDRDIRKMGVRVFFSVIWVFVFYAISGIIFAITFATIATFNNENANMLTDPFYTYILYLIGIGVPLLLSIKGMLPKTNKYIQG